VNKGLSWGNLRKRDHLEDPDLDGRMILKRILKKEFGRASTGLIKIREGKSSRIL
jgi:hypothetical protein